MKNHRNVIFKWLLLIALVVIGLITIKTCNGYKDTLNERELMVKALNDSIQYFKDKDGLNKARISVLETSNLEYFTSLSIKDQEIKNLQNLVSKNKKNLESATIIKTITKIDTIIKEVKVKADDNIREAFYDLNGWAYGSIISYRDSTGISINIKNDLSIVHKKDKKGSYVEVFDKNPYTTTEAIRSYYKLNKPTKKSNWSLGINASYGVNYKGEFMPYIGVGINRNLINF